MYVHVSCLNFVFLLFLQLFVLMDRSTSMYLRKMETAIEKLLTFSLSLGMMNIYSNRELIRNNNLSRVSVVRQRVVNYIRIL